MALNIRSMPDFDVTAVPFLWAADPDLSGFQATIGLTADHEAFYETREWLPVAEMNATVREPVLVDYDPKENMHLVLRDVALLLVADGASGYYMGVPPWKAEGVLGIAMFDSRASVSRFDGHTIAHEFGHNFWLRHAPCGGPAGADGQYPHSGGRIGAWGYDFRDGTLVDPDVFTDLMTYCRTNDWISDYSFTKAFEYRAATEAARVSHVVEQVLVVRGGVAGGRLDIQPAFVLDAPPTLPERAGPYRLVGSDPQGEELFALRFDMQEVADPEAEGDAGFTFAIPARAEWADALAAITLTGPEGSVALVRDDPASAAATLVLDAATRRTQAILHGLPEQTVAARSTPARVAGHGYPVQSRHPRSRGVETMTTAVPTPPSSFAHRRGWPVPSSCRRELADRSTARRVASRRGGRPRKSCRARPLCTQPERNSPARTRQYDASNPWLLGGGARDRRMVLRVRPRGHAGELVTGTRHPLRRDPVRIWPPVEPRLRPLHGHDAGGCHRRRTIPVASPVGRR